MSLDAISARDILEAWREQRADRLNPVRFHYMDALERRATHHVGEPRRLLDERLQQLIEAYAHDFEAAASKRHDGAATPAAPAPSALSELVDYIASRNPVSGDGTDDDIPRPSLFPELGVLGEVRKLWSRVRTESQLRESLQQVPTNAGPLNSGNLVHRSITLMQDLSPGYLQQFLSYVDALTWMEQMNDGGALVVQEAPRAAPAKKRARSKPRERRE